MALTYNEDADLRRLEIFAKFGMLSGEAERRYDDLRGRDRRLMVREPEDIISQNPVPLKVHPRREWGQ